MGVVMSVGDARDVSVPGKHGGVVVGGDGRRRSRVAFTPHLCLGQWKTLEEAQLSRDTFSENWREITFEVSSLFIVHSIADGGATNSNNWPHRTRNNSTYTLPNTLAPSSSNKTAATVSRAVTHIGDGDGDGDVSDAESVYGIRCQLPLGGAAGPSKFLKDVVQKVEISLDPNDTAYTSRSLLAKEASAAAAPTNASEYSASESSQDGEPSEEWTAEESRRLAGRGRGDSKTSTVGIRLAMLSSRASSPMGSWKRDIGVRIRSNFSGGERRPLKWQRGLAASLLNTSGARQAVVGGAERSQGCLVGAGEEVLPVVFVEPLTRGAYKGVGDGAKGEGLPLLERKQSLPSIERNLSKTGSDESEASLVAWLESQRQRFGGHRAEPTGSGATVRSKTKAFSSGSLLGSWLGTTQGTPQGKESLKDIFGGYSGKGLFEISTPVYTPSGEAVGRWLSVSGRGSSAAQTTWERIGRPESMVGGKRVEGGMIRGEELSDSRPSSYIDLFLEEHGTLLSSPTPSPFLFPLPPSPIPDLVILHGCRCWGAGRREGKRGGVLSGWRGESERLAILHVVWMVVWWVSSQAFLSLV